MEKVNSGSMIATAGSINALRILAFCLCSSLLNTEFLVTSAPVPAVVGMAIKGTLALVIDFPNSLATNQKKEPFPITSM